MAIWTRARLERTLKARYGTGARGGLNAAAAARDLGVSTSTVYRWLRVPSPRSKIRIPDERVAKLEQVVSVEPYLVEREKAAADRARWNLEFVRKNGAQMTWAKQRWLEPHVVQIVRPVGKSVRQITFRRVGELPAKEPRRRRVIVISQVEVSSRFHAEILVHLVLEHVGRWRVLAQQAEVDQGPTRSWTTSGAPSVPLEDLVDQLPRPVSKRRRDEARRRYQAAVAAR